MLQTTCRHLVRPLGPLFSSARYVLAAGAGAPVLQRLSDLLMRSGGGAVPAKHGSRSLASAAAAVPPPGGAAGLCEPLNYYGRRMWIVLPHELKPQCSLWQPHHDAANTGGADNEPRIENGIEGALRCIGVLSPDKAKDIMRLTHSFPAPLLARALREREDALHAAAELLESGRPFEDLHAVLAPFKRHAVVRRHKSGEISHRKNSQR